MGKRVFALVVGLVLTSAVYADPRPFAFTYDTYSIDPGHWEYEQYITYKADRDDMDDYSRWEFQHEIEFGVADNFDVGLYLARWSITDTGDDEETEFDGVKVRGIFYPSNPVTDWIGSGIYNEIAIDNDELKFEQKLLLQKDWEFWTLAYNLVFETEIEHVFDTDEETEVEGKIKHLLAASYAASPSWKLGAELVVETPYDDWEDRGDTRVYAGPAIHYQGGEVGIRDWTWWVTVTPMIQLTDVDSAENWRVGSIIALEL